MNVNGKLYTYCDWIMKFGYINLLWWLFTVMGLFIFGISPATIALFTITRKWLRGETEIPIWSVFWRTYKSEFIRSNFIGLIYLLIGFLFYEDGRIMLKRPGSLNIFITLLLLVIAILFLISSMYLFPVYVHFQLKTVSYIKYSLMMGISQFPYTIIMIAAVWLNYMILKFLPGVFLFFGMSLLSFTLMWAGDKAFHKAQMKVSQL
jgi:uncharacterized membrane protein YesL